MQILGNNMTAAAYFFAMLLLGPMFIAAIIASRWRAWSCALCWKILFAFFMLTLLPVALWILLENSASLNPLICLLSFPSFQAAECATLPRLWLHFVDILFLYTVPLILTLRYAVRWTKRGFSAEDSVNA